MTLKKDALPKKMDPRILLIYRRKILVRRLYYLSLLQSRPRPPPFDIHQFTNSECDKLFRFQADDIIILRRLLRIPFSIKCASGTKCNGVEGTIINFITNKYFSSKNEIKSHFIGFCMLLRRLAYPNRLFDLSLLFRRSVSDLSKIINFLSNHIVIQFGHLLEDLGQDWLSNANLRRYANAIHRKGAPLENCWGFIDGMLNTTIFAFMATVNFFLLFIRNSSTNVPSYIPPKTSL